MQDGSVVIHVDRERLKDKIGIDHQGVIDLVGDIQRAIQQVVQRQPGMNKVELNQYAVEVMCTTGSPLVIFMPVLGNIDSHDAGFDYYPTLDRIEAALQQLCYVKYSRLLLVRQSKSMTYNFDVIPMVTTERTT